MIIFSNRRLVKLLTFNFATAITIFPFIILKFKNHKNDLILINHEKIHIRQQLELLIIPFYIVYILEFVFHLIRIGNKRDAYLNISFEKEAYSNELNLNYLQNRKFWSFIKYFKS